jgi:CubicO group peptidase (beta-lactamase class C family)
MEQMVEDVTGRPFEQAMGERVLEPAGMARSTYEQPLPPGRWGEAARGHRGDGSEVEGEWHNYPEQAAAGLWTTPSDLLTLSAQLLDILEGSETDGVVSRETLETMLEPHRFGEEGFESYGLGFGIEGEGETLSFGHGGSNAGFRAQWMVFPALGDGAVVMTNGARGAQLASEVLRALAEAYDWPRPRAEVRAHRTLAAEALAEYAGDYVLEEEPDLVFTIRAGEGVLLLDVPDQGTYTLHADAEVDDRFFDASDGQTLTFERDEDGMTTALVLPGDERMTRR